MYMLMFPANVFPLFRKNVWEEYNADTIVLRGRLQPWAQACGARRTESGSVAEVNRHTCSLIAANSIVKQPELTEFRHS